MSPIVHGTMMCVFAAPISLSCESDPFKWHLSADLKCVRIRIPNAHPRVLRGCHFCAVGTVGAEGYSLRSGGGTPKKKGPQQQTTADPDIMKSVFTSTQDSFGAMLNSAGHKTLFADVVKDKLFAEAVSDAVSKRAKAVCPNKKRLDEVVKGNGATVDQLLKTALKPALENAVKVRSRLTFVYCTVLVLYIYVGDFLALFSKYGPGRTKGVCIS